jgi:predicted HTH transcriptional regulator
MTQKQKLYFIIQERRIVSLKDLEDITRWQRITILRAIAPLVIRRKIKAVISESTRYFKINDKPLKNG